MRLKSRGGELPPIHESARFTAVSANPYTRLFGLVNVLYHTGWVRLSRVTKRRRDPPWDLDGINHGPSSNAILLQWISTKDNYHQWDSTTFEPTERLTICEEIVQLMQMQGIAHRHARGINTRIQILWRSYNTTREFVNHARGNTNEIAPVILGMPGGFAHIGISWTP
ncbi:uncharacterized protein PGTG_05843 [Puccinia graminis f. sp. tritici CRL 75-36-700-3]|uniref:Uncharacterized protein n=1 Tax=Puccinia graminis f. sp. tritici (strain CRL 75-36-700-3 / race SCCL) TaxID=418459 RepID=E3K5V1_PUCGT|nr:uncharacterized protein PGTG_05843 [Puccinia graminis f. sp. tritici CRL 75-36-700-3]EFP79522.2 hypothetical protein PGTG_05843 [Puccinia graminis f. sp. tritici CRL 75-36-700-3]